MVADLVVKMSVVCGDVMLKKKRRFVLYQPIHGHAQKELGWGCTECGCEQVHILY